MSTQFYFPPYNKDRSWKKFDVVQQQSSGIFYYATQDINTSASDKLPTSIVTYNISSWTREDDIVTIYYTKSSDGYNFFKQGAIVTVTVPSNTSLNYVGMIIDGDGSSTSGWIKYVNPGWNDTGSGGTVYGNPEWTTGFMFAPTYGTKIGTKNQVIMTQLGNGYSQRMSNGVNTFQQQIDLMFQNRSSREARAITNFIQDKMGKDAFQILLMDPMINNQPNQKYVAADINVNPTSYNLYEIGITVIRVFEP